MLTKVDSPEHVHAVAEIVDELEAERGLPAGKMKFVVLVETAAGFFRIEAIAKSHPRVVALSLGTEDFTADVGMLPDPEALFYPKQHTLFAARAAGILPMGFVGSIADFRDQEAFRAIVRRSKRLRLHRRQRDPSAAGAGAERGIRRLTEQRSNAPNAWSPPTTRPSRKGLGAVQFEGAMIDVPVVQRAKNVLARAAAIKRAGGTTAPARQA